MTIPDFPDLARLLPGAEDLPPGYKLTAELHTEDRDETAGTGPSERGALDARSVEYTSVDGRRVIQATVFLNADAETAAARVSDILTVEPDLSDPHAVRMETRTGLPTLGVNAVAATHVVEKGEAQAIVHMIAFAQMQVTAVLVLWDLTEELEIDDSLAVAEAFSQRVREGLAGSPG